MSNSNNHRKPRKFWGPLISFAVSILLYVLPRVFTGKDIDIIYALDLISVIIAFSTVLAFIFSQFVGQNKKEHIDIVDKTIPVVNGLKDTNSEEHHKIAKTLALLSTEFTPRDYSPAGDEPNTEFNAIIKEELCQQRCHHFYFSNRAFYHSWRLYNYSIDSRTSEFSIVLPHVQEEKIFTAMAENRMQQGGSSINRQNQLKQQIIIAREDTFKSIYYVKRLIENGLNISLFIHTEIPFIRFEQTDNILAMSFLPMTRNGSYPPSIIYKRESLHWDAFNAYSRQLIQGSKYCLKTAEEIINYLNDNFDQKKLGTEKSFDLYILELDDSFDLLVNEIKK